MKVQSLGNAYYQRLDCYYFSIVRSLVTCCSSRACPKCTMIRSQQHSFAVLASSMSILNLLVFIYAIFLVWQFICQEPAQSQLERHYSRIFLCCFKFLSVEFRQNLGQLESFVYKLFGNFTFAQKLSQNGHLRWLHSIVYIVILFRVRVNSSKLYREKLYGKNLLIQCQLKGHFDLA